MKSLGIALALVLSLAASMVLTGADAAGGASPRMLHLLDVSERSTPAFDAGQSGPRPGDRVFLSDALYGWNGAKRGARVGEVESTLTFMSAFGAHGATVEISGQMFLNGGSLFVQGIGRVNQGPNHFTLPVIGGTGIYTGARGVLDLRDIGHNEDKSSVDIRLLAS